MNYGETNLHFALKAYHWLRSSSVNICFCPVSVHLAFGMLLMGCRENSRKQLREALVVNDELDDLSGYGAQSLNMMKQLLEFEKGDENKPNSNALVLKLANRLFTDVTMQEHLLTSYLSTLKEYFLSELVKVDFSKSENAAEIINGFVREITCDKIKEVFSPRALSRDTKLVIVNAAYFKAQWVTKFEPADTIEDSFHLFSGEKKAVKLMNLSAKRFPSLNDEANSLQAVEMPFVRPGQFSLIILLPMDRSADSLEKLENRLHEDPMELQRIVTSLKPHYINLSVPRFRIDAQTDMKAMMTSLGSADIFDPKSANLSGISSVDGLFVNQAIQKTYLDVDENGCEAAAVTALGIMCMSAPIQPRSEFSIRVDHPFMYALWSRALETCLFIGRVRDP